jgi:germination protein YpeB
VGDIPTYGIEIPPNGPEAVPVYVDVSKLDGSIIWVLKPRTVAQAQIELEQAGQKGLEFLEAHGFKNMVLVEAERADSTAICTYVPRQDEVLLYPDQVKVQVALDNGEVLGYEGTPYYMFHRDRELPSGRLTKEQITAKISPYLKTEIIRPALIVNNRGQEILAWEVRGKVNEDETFVVFYNAESGREEQIVRLTPPLQFRFSLAEEGNR